MIGIIAEHLEKFGGGFFIATGVLKLGGKNQSCAHISLASFGSMTQFFEARLQFPFQYQCLP